MNFEKAIALFKEGRYIRRKGWVTSWCRNGGYMTLAENATYIFTKEDFMASDWEIYGEPTPILDREEREYLEAVIKPFKSRICTVHKVETMNNADEYIEMVLDNGSYDFTLPTFRKGSAFQGMEAGVEYSLEKLKLK